MSLNARPRCLGARRLAARYLAALVALVVAAAPACVSSRYVPEPYPQARLMLKNSAPVYLTPEGKTTASPLSSGLTHGLSGVPAAAAVADEAQDDALFGLVFIVGGPVVMGSGATILLLDALDDDVSTTGQVLSIGLVLTGAAMMLAGANFVMESEAKRFDAVNMYNDAMLKHHFNQIRAGVEPGDWTLPAGPIGLDGEPISPE